mmetsp:Transcript_23145/g.55832  ORF Transcript_23145/g.55832 Transcript_23145/m.55832 type:complete len:248 (-) Transcript_23145:202-945(-)
MDWSFFLLPSDWGRSAPHGHVFLLFHHSFSLGRSYPALRSLQIVHCFPYTRVQNIWSCRPEDCAIVAEMPKTVQVFPRTFYHIRGEKARRPRMQFSPLESRTLCAPMYDRQHPLPQHPQKAMYRSLSKERPRKECGHQPQDHTLGHPPFSALGFPQHGHDDDVYSGYESVSILASLAPVCRTQRRGCPLLQFGQSWDHESNSRSCHSNRGTALLPKILRMYSSWYGTNYYSLYTLGLGRRGKGWIEN